MECVCESMCIWVGGVFCVSLGLSVHACVCASMCAYDVLLGLFLAEPTCRSECVYVCVCVCVCVWVGEVIGEVWTFLWMCLCASVTRCSYL